MIIYDNEVISSGEPLVNPDEEFFQIVSRLEDIPFTKEEEAKLAEEATPKPEGTMDQGFRED